jgi:hypothetical protein
MSVRHHLNLSPLPLLLPFSNLDEVSLTLSKFHKKMCSLKCILLFGRPYECVRMLNAPLIPIPCMPPIGRFLHLNRDWPCLPPLILSHFAAAWCAPCPCHWLTPVEYPLDLWLFCQEGLHSASHTLLTLLYPFSLPLCSNLSSQKISLIWLQSLLQMNTLLDPRSIFETPHWHHSAISRLNFASERETWPEAHPSLPYRCLRPGASTSACGATPAIAIPWPKTTFAVAPLWGVPFPMEFRT